jgi:shikimate dehydrogenase
MKMYGLIGFPLTHSFSQKYFTEKFEREGIPDTSYGNFPLKSIPEFPELLKTYPAIRGLNVTIPYKEQVLQYVNHSSEEVKETGASNCIKIYNGELYAYNTDIIGFRESFLKKIKPHHKKALILGSGGSSKAVQYVLNKLGIDFLIVSRTNNGKERSIQYGQLSREILNEFTGIINCTPLGMSPNEESCPGIPYSFLTPEHYLFDLVYNPAKTQFLKKGEKQGATTENGYEMLVLQAEASWKIWNEGLV